MARFVTRRCGHWKAKRVKISISRSITILAGITAGLALAGIEFRVGLRLRVSDFFTLATLPLILLAYLRGTPRHDLLPIMIALWAYMTYTYFNALALSDIGSGAKEVIQMIIFYPLALIIYVLAVQDDAAFQRFSKIYYVLLWGCVLYGTYWHVSQGMISGWKDLNEQKLSYGVLVTSTVALAHPRLLWGRKLTLLLICAVVLALLSGERKGWIAAFAGCLAMLPIAKHGRLSRKSLNRLVYFSGAMLVLVVIAMVIAPAVPYLDKQLSSIGEFLDGLLGGGSVEQTTISNQARLFTLDFGMDLFRQSPIFGNGYNQFVSLVMLIPGNDIHNGAHNEILRIAAELGSVGLVLYGMIYVAAFLRFRQALAVSSQLTDLQFCRLRFGFGMLVYGFVVNFFLTAGGTAMFFVIFPIALIHSVPLRGRQGAPGTTQPALAMMRGAG